MKAIKILIIVFAVTGVVAYLVSKIPSTQKPRPTEQQAYIITENFIKSQLKAPADAVFPVYEYEHKKVNDSTFVIKSYVDSPNDFGVKKRMHYVSQVRFVGSDVYDDRHWQLDTLVVAE